MLTMTDYLFYFSRYLTGWGLLEEDDQPELSGDIQLLDASGGFNPTKYSRFPSHPLGTGQSMMVAIVVGLVSTCILLIFLRKPNKPDDAPDTTELQGVNGLYLAVFLDAAGVFLFMPYMGMLSMQMHLSALEAMMVGTCYAATNAIGNVCLGMLADHVGRKKILTTTLGAASVSLVLTGFAIKLPFGLDESGNRVGTNWAYVTLIIARVIAAFFASTVSIIQTMIAERSTDEMMTANMAKVLSFFTLGVMSGPIIGGFVYDFGFPVLCFSGGAITMVNTLWAALTLDPTQTRPPKAAEGNEQEAQKGPVETPSKTPSRDALVAICSNPFLSLLFFGCFCSAATAAVSGSVGGLFFLQVYQWGPRQIAIFFLIGGTLSATANMKLPGLWSSMCNDGITIIIGFGLGSIYTLIGNVFFITPATPWIMLVPGCVVGTMIASQIQSLVAKLGPKQSLGTLFGLLEATRLIAEAVVPPIGGYLLDRNLKAPFIVSSVLCLFCGVLYLPFAFKKTPAEDKSEPLLA